MSTTMRLEARNVSKTFGSTTVLREADLAVAPGEIHALIGQNGSGKSTLVKILTGYHAPDAGASLAVDGQVLDLPVRWSEAAAAGVSVVHQDLGLLDQLTVAENIGIGGFPHHRLSRKIDWQAQDAVAQRVLDRLDVPVDPRTPVARLSAMRRAEVAIARALRDQHPGTGVVILDEATRALPREELARFHQLLRTVVADGTAVLMVSHNLSEVLQLADRVTVLRDGAVAAGGLSTAGLTEHDLAKHMLGKAVESVGRRERRPGSTVVAARVEGLCADGLGPVTFQVAPGEVVGLTGLPGSGFEAIAQLVTGGRRPQAGTLTTRHGNVDLSKADVTRCMALGAALVPEKRDPRGPRRRAEHPRQHRAAQHPPPGPALARRPPVAGRRGEVVDRPPRHPHPVAAHARQGALRRQPAEGAFRQVAVRRARPARTPRADPGRRRRRPGRHPARRRRDGRPRGRGAAREHRARRPRRRLRPHPRQRS